MKTDGTSIAENLEIINRRIAEACRRSGRKVESVRLLAVSKGQPVQKIRAAYEAGHRSFAENYVQESLQKLNELENLAIAWHFIGRIQSNKVKLLAGRFRIVHSVDRLSVAQALDVASPRPQEIFLQYNVADEVSKGGGREKDVIELAKATAKMKNLRVTGIMVMPPLFENPEEARPYFRKARELAGSFGFQELSMGTSHDFEVAIEEGATWVRVGTEIFGARGEAE